MAAQIIHEIRQRLLQERAGSQPALPLLMRGDAGPAVSGCSSTSVSDSTLTCCCLMPTSL